MRVTSKTFFLRLRTAKSRLVFGRTAITHCPLRGCCGSGKCDFYQHIVLQFKPPGDTYRWLCRHRFIWLSVGIVHNELCWIVKINIEILRGNSVAEEDRIGPHVPIRRIKGCYDEVEDPTTAEAWLRRKAESIHHRRSGRSRRHYQSSGSLSSWMNQVPPPPRKPHWPA